MQKPYQQSQRLRHFTDIFFSHKFRIRLCSSICPSIYSPSIYSMVLCMYVPYFLYALCASEKRIPVHSGRLHIHRVTKLRTVVIISGVARDEESISGA